MKRYPKLKQAGFTLIELLVVVLIVGILAAIALPLYQNAVYKTRVQEAVQTLRVLERAWDAYYIQNGTYPQSLDDLDITAPTESQYWRYSVNPTPGALTNENGTQPRYFYTIGAWAKFGSSTEKLCSNVVVYNLNKKNGVYGCLWANYCGKFEKAVRALGATTEGAVGCYTGTAIKIQ